MRKIMFMAAILSMVCFCGIRTYGEEVVGNEALLRAIGKDPAEAKRKTTGKKKKRHRSRDDRHASDSERTNWKTKDDNGDEEDESDDEIRKLRRLSRGGLTKLAIQELNRAVKDIASGIMKKRTAKKNKKEIAASEEAIVYD